MLCVQLHLLYTIRSDKIEMEKVSSIYRRYQRFMPLFSKPTLPRYHLVFWIFKRFVVTLLFNVLLIVCVTSVFDFVLLFITL